MQLVRLLPDGHRMKREVDMALDSVSETMTPMHYHLREIIISTYRQVRHGIEKPQLQVYMWVDMHFVISLKFRGELVAVVGGFHFIF